MHWQYSINGFQFHNYQFFDNEIQPVATVKPDPFIFDWQRYLLFEFEIS
jgi:hypothetical protein